LAVEMPSPDMQASVSKITINFFILPPCLPAGRLIKVHE